MASDALSRNWVRKLRRFVRAPSASEYCDLCSAEIPADHAHMVDLESRRLLCACRGCATLVARPDGVRYRTVPREAHVLGDFRLTDAEWDALQIPIDMAFLFHSTPEGRPVALYPGPAGTTESALSLDAWSRVIANNPVLADMQPDVEALLVNRTNGSREYYRMPIDRCYQLVGLIRTHWRGLSGGTDVWDGIRDYFAQLRQVGGASGYGATETWASGERDP